MHLVRKLKFSCVISHNFYFYFFWFFFGFFVNNIICESDLFSLFLKLVKSVVSASHLVSIQMCDVIAFFGPVAKSKWLYN